LIPLILLISAGTVIAQSSTNYTIHKFVTAQGGGASSSANYLVRDSAGQPSPVGAMSSTNYGAYSGYWGDGVLGTDVADDPDIALPTTFRLRQNYPNPFNPATTIEYDLPHEADVFLKIYDLKGNEVRRYNQGMLTAGTHLVQWNGRNGKGNLVASGLYFYRIEAKTEEKLFVDVKRMIYMK